MVSFEEAEEEVWLAILGYKGISGTFHIKVLRACFVAMGLQLGLIVSIRASQLPNWRWLALGACFDPRLRSRMDCSTTSIRSWAKCAWSAWMANFKATAPEAAATEVSRSAARVQSAITSNLQENALQHNRVARERMHEYAHLSWMEGLLRPSRALQGS